MKLDMRNGALEIIPESKKEELAIETIFLGLGGKFDEWIPATGPISALRREHPEAPLELLIH